MTAVLAGCRLEPGRPGTALGPGGELVHLARRRAGAAVDDEVAALLAAAGPHVPRLIDIATATNGDVVLVLEHLPFRLADLLQVPGWPTPGEAVTVLAPLAQTVAALGVARVRHGAVGPNAVRFDEAGRPVLTRFASAGLMDPDDSSAADAQAVRLLAETLLERSGAADLARRIASDRPGPAALAELLFDSADPRPVRLDPVPAAAANVPARLVDVPLVVSPPVPRSAAVSALALVRLRVGAAARASAARLAVRLRTVRRRVWTVAGVSVALLAAALVLLPSHDDRSAAESVPSRSHAEVAVRSPTPSLSTGATSDPVRAVRALLDARAAWLAAARTACLAGVEAADSPLYADDLAAVRAGAEARATPQGTPRVLRTSGGTALLSVGSATVLAVRQPDGWRLRDLVGAG